MADFALRCGTIAQVDAELIPVFQQHTWKIDKWGYARRTTTRGRTALMHRAVANPAPEECIDHIDGDKLNNMAANLRVATGYQNNCNKKKRDGCQSKYKGVGRANTLNKWVARITPEGLKLLHLGTFETEDEAAHAYNKAALIYHGDFAVLNPVGTDYEAQP